MDTNYTSHQNNKGRHSKPHSVGYAYLEYNIIHVVILSNNLNFVNFEKLLSDLHQDTIGVLLVSTSCREMSQRMTMLRNLYGVVRQTERQIF